MMGHNYLLQIYDPSVTTIKPPKHRESLPWYLAGESTGPPADFLIPPEQSQTFGLTTKTRNSWGKYPESQIEQRGELGITFGEATSVGQEQYKEDEPIFGREHETFGDKLGPRDPQFKNGNGKHKIPSEQSLYEGITDDEKVGFNLNSY